MLRIRDLVLLAAVGAVVAPASLSAENRDSWRTDAGEEITVRGTRENRRTGDGGVDATVESSRNGRVIIKTTSGERMTIGNVPVEFRGDEYRVSDLERGDSIRIFFEPSSDGVRRARRIEVLRSVSDSSSDRSRRRDRDDDEDRDSRGRNRERSREVRRDSSRDRDRNFLTGRVTSVNDRNQTFVIATDDGRDVRVDGYELSSRYGSSLERIRRGDQLSLRGEFVAGGAFRAREIAGRGSDERNRVRPERRGRQSDDRTERNRNWRDSDRRDNDEDDEDDDDGDEDDDNDDDNDR